MAINTANYWNAGSITGPVWSSKMAPVPRGATQAQAFAIQSSNLYTSVNRTKNPFGNASQGFLQSISAFAELDNNFGFDGRYFHLGDYPQPINKTQVKAATYALQHRLYAATDPHSFLQLKYHLTAIKFLYALNKANKYIKGLIKMDGQNQNWTNLTPEQITSKTTKMQQEQLRLLAGLARDPMQISTDTRTAINEGLIAARNFKRQAIGITENELGQAGPIITNLNNRKNYEAQRSGFADNDAKKTYMKNKSAALKGLVMDDVYAEVLVNPSYGTIDHQNQLTGFNRPEGRSNTTAMAGVPERLRRTMVQGDRTAYARRAILARGNAIREEAKQPEPGQQATTTNLLRQGGVGGMETETLSVVDAKLVAGKILGLSFTVLDAQRLSNEVTRLTNLNAIINYMANGSINAAVNLVASNLLSSAYTKLLAGNAPNAAEQSYLGL